MRKTLPLLSALLMVSAAVPAGETKPPALRPGDQVRLNAEKPTATVTGWINFNWGAKLRVKIEKVTEEHKHLKPGRDVELVVRHVPVKHHKRAKKTRMTPVKEEVQLLRRLQTGDRVEFQYRSVDKYRMITAYKLLFLFPREGKLVGSYVKRHKETAMLMLTKTPKGGEHMVGHKTGVSPDWIRIKDKWQPDPEKLKLIDGMQKGHLLEVTYKLAGRFRVQSVKDLGAAPTPPKPEPHQKKHKKPKGEPPMASQADPEPL